jgi:hypothetical protein
MKKRFVVKSEFKMARDMDVTLVLTKNLEIKTKHDCDGHLSFRKIMNSVKAFEITSISKGVFRSGFRR